MLVTDILDVPGAFWIDAADPHVCMYFAESGDQSASPGTVYALAEVTIFSSCVMCEAVDCCTATNGCSIDKANTRYGGHYSGLFECFTTGTTCSGSPAHTIAIDFDYDVANTPDVCGESQFNTFGASEADLLAYGISNLVITYDGAPIALGTSPYTDPVGFNNFLISVGGGAGEWVLDVEWVIDTGFGFYVVGLSGLPASTQTVTGDCTGVTYTYGPTCYDIGDAAHSVRSTVSMDMAVSGNEGCA